MSVSKYMIVCALLVGMSGTAMAAKVVATVNGHKITEKQLNEYMQYRQSTTRQNISKDKKAILEEMINRELLMQQVKKKKLDKNPRLAYMAKQQRSDLYIQALLHGDADIAKPVPESEVKKIYEEKVKNHKLKEYKIRHILLKTKAAADSVIAKLDKGAKFEDLAKKDSTGPSAKEGGELGWVNIEQLHNTPALAQAISELKKGKYTEKPVKTKYGWHVVKLEDERLQSPPSLKEVHNQIVAALRRQRLQKYVGNLRDSAKIHINLK